MKNKGGRPPIHTDPDHVETLVRQYFEYIEGEFEIKEEEYIDENGVERKTKVKEWIRKPEPPTVTGLTLHIGFNSKNTLYEYAKKEGFSDSIKRGLTLIEQFHEKKVSSGDKCVGNIFILKNFGWKDKSETDINLTHIQPLFPEQ